MAIFEKKNLKKFTSHKLVGGYLPLSIVNYISLYTVSSKKSKNDVLLKATNEWVEKHKRNLSENMLCKQIAREAIQVWNQRKLKRGTTLSIFCEEVNQELLKKGISSSHIEIILKSIKDGADK